MHELDNHSNNHEIFKALQVIIEIPQKAGKLGGLIFSFV